ncbi:MAG: tRNA (adenosine(37)-N6)-dimethylallyltransferase MiaA, partial [Limnobacter sp.]|nr:tRNA (adenosine(37)-N6)-dimethylallyltransferase MiaA [Limnobacter sp.]
TQYPNLKRTLPSMRCVGYRQVWEFLEDEVSFDDMRLKGIAATRQLAKRQITWLRSIPGQNQIDPLHEGWQEQAMKWLTEQVTNLLPKK